MNNKKLFAFLILSVFLLALFPTVSATLKDYDTNKRIVHLEKSFLGIPTGDIADVQLITPLNYKVGLGYQKVAEMKVSGFTDYTDFITDMEFYDKKNEMTKFNREFDLKKKEIIQVSVDDYNCDNILIINGNNTGECIVNGSHLEYREIWSKLQRVDFKKNDILTVAIFTNVNEGDVVEWIPSFTSNNVRVQEWAVWTADLNTNIISYFKLDDTSPTTAIDSVVSTGNDGTVTGATHSATGIINTAYSFDGTGSDYISMGDVMDTGTGAYSVSAWVKTSYTGSWQQVVSKSAGSATSSWEIRLKTGTGQVDFSFREGAVFDGATSTTSVTDGSWHHILLTRPASGGTIVLYIDGVSSSTATNNNRNTNNAFEFRVGKTDGTIFPFNGQIDEVSVWNREITPTETTQIYDAQKDGFVTGQYTNVFGSPPIVTAISPADATTDITTGIKDFTCYGKDAENFTEMEFYFDGVLDQSNSTGLNNTNYTFQKTLIDGNYNWTCIGYDNEANTGTFATRNYSIDTTPFIEIINPTEGEEIKIDSVTVNVTLTETNFDELIINLNYTNGTLADTITITDLTRGYVFTGVGDGNYNVESIVNTNTSKTNSSSVTFLVHTTIPEILITAPTGIIPFIKIGESEQLNYSISEIGQNISHFNECWFEYNNTEVLLNSSFTPSFNPVWEFPS